MSVNPSRPDLVDREQLARLLPAPVERDLPGGRHHILREHLMNEIHEHATPQKTAVPQRRMRRLALAGAFAVAGALAVAIGPALLGQHAGSQAWAVEAGADGAVTVRINEVRDAAGLEERLLAEGIHALVDYIPADKGCAYPGHDGLTTSRYDAVFQTGRVGGDGVVFTIDRGELKPTDTVGIIAIASPDGDKAAGFMLNVIEGPAKHCVPNDKPFIRYPDTK